MQQCPGVTVDSSMRDNASNLAEDLCVNGRLKKKVKISNLLVTRASPYFPLCIHHFSLLISSLQPFLKVTGYREMGVVWNKTFLPFSSSANAQNLLTTLETIVFKRFYRFLVAQETP